MPKIDYEIGHRCHLHKHFMHIIICCGIISCCVLKTLYGRIHKIYEGTHGQTEASGDNPIKRFTIVIYRFRNKLQCLFLVSPSSLI